MKDYIFFNFLFSNFSEYLIYAVGISIVLYLITRKTIGYYLDPFHFYYTFTFGTSYAIVLILYVHGFVSDFYFFILFLYAFIFLFSFILFGFLGLKDKKPGLFYRLVKSCENQEKLLIKCFVTLYAILMLVYLSQVSSAVFYSSRFEANRGLGPIVRVMDALRLILAAWFYIYYIRTRKNKYIIAAIFVSIIGAMLSGAKFALLEQLYVMFVAGYIADGKKIKINFATILVFMSIACVLYFFVSYFLLKTSVAIGYSNSQYIPGAPVTLELLILRILANGDQYYLSLTNELLDKITIDSPFIQLFSNIFGNGLMSKMVGYDISNQDIGRQIWLYWYPSDDIMRGPTPHFDLAGYSYFGVLGGAVFTMIIGCVLGKINAMKKKYSCGSVVIASFIAVLYCRSLPIILNPAVGIAYIIDIFLLAFLSLVMISFLKGTIRDAG